MMLLTNAAYGSHGPTSYALPFAGFWKFFVRAPNIHRDVDSTASEKES